MLTGCFVTVLDSIHIHAQRYKRQSAAPCQCRLTCDGTWSGVQKCQVTFTSPFINNVWRNYTTLKLILNNKRQEKGRRIMTYLAFNSIAVISHTVDSLNRDGKFLTEANELLQAHSPEPVELVVAFSIWEDIKLTWVLYVAWTLRLIRSISLMVSSFPWRISNSFQVCQKLAVT